MVRFSRLFAMSAIFFFLSSGALLPLSERVQASNEKKEGIVIDPETWRQISLAIYDDIGNLKLDIKLLRNLSWINETGAEVGGTIQLSIPEKGIINEKARVLAIDPCPQIQSGDGNLVTGTFRSFGDVLKITLESGESFECTYGHRFFSEKQNDWVPAIDLSVGERIKAKDGFVTIKSIEPEPGKREVLNLEVSDKHTYCVTSENVVSHNTGECSLTYNPDKPNALIKPGGKPTIAYLYLDSLAPKDTFFGKYFDLKWVIREVNYQPIFEEHIADGMHQPSWYALFKWIESEQAFGELACQGPDPLSRLESFKNIFKTIDPVNEFNGFGTPAFTTMYDRLWMYDNWYNPNIMGTKILVAEVQPRDYWIYTRTHEGFDPASLLNTHDDRFGYLPDKLEFFRQAGMVFAPRRTMDPSDIISIHVFHNKGLLRIWRPGQGFTD